jgi:hypothetical protein
VGIRSSPEHACACATAYIYGSVTGTMRVPPSLTSKNFAHARSALDFWTRFQQGAPARLSS